MRVFFAIIALAMLSGCGVFDNEQSVPAKLVGEWEWTRTEGGWTHPISADTAGYTMTLEIYSQNEAAWFRNDTLQNNYIIQKGNTDWTKGEFVMRRMNSKDGHGCGFILDYYPETKELLLPSANCTDFPTIHFKKAGR